MHDIIDVAREAVYLLNQSGVEYLVCGGFAFGVHAEIRATVDIDVIIHDESAIAAIDEQLLANGWLSLSEPMDFEDGFRLHRRLKPIGKQLIPLDILIPPPALDLFSDPIRSEIAGAGCFVISREALKTMKRLAGRDKDLLDLRRLEDGDAAQS